MKIFKTLAFIALFASIFIIACKPKDADIKTALETSINTAGLTGTTVQVTEGVVTLTGELKDEAAKQLAETTAKAVKGVKSVVNNITITPPPAPIIVNTDDVLINAVKDAVKDYPTVVATVNAGVLSLTGEIKKANLPKLMMALSALKAKKIDNKLTVK